MKIIIKGEAVVTKETGGVIRGTENLSVFDGVTDDSVFSEYFHSKDKWGENQQSVIDAGVSGGDLVFKIEGSKLFAVTAYDTPRKLSSEEEKVLVEYTQGQWSDGIGEGFEQQECNGGFLSAWHPNQEVKVSYLD